MQRSVSSSRRLWWWWCLVLRRPKCGSQLQNAHACSTSIGTMAAGPDGVDLWDVRGSGRDGRAGLGWMDGRLAGDRAALSAVLCCAVLCFFWGALPVSRLAPGGLDGGTAQPSRCAGRTPGFPFACSGSRAAAPSVAEGGQADAIMRTQTQSTPTGRWHACPTMPFFFRGVSWSGALVFLLAGSSGAFALSFVRRPFVCILQCLMEQHSQSRAQPEQTGQSRTRCAECHPDSGLGLSSSAQSSPRMQCSPLLLFHASSFYFVPDCFALSFSSGGTPSGPLLPADTILRLYAYLGHSEDTAAQTASGAVICNYQWFGR